MLKNAEEPATFYLNKFSAKYDIKRSESQVLLLQDLLPLWQSIKEYSIWQQDLLKSAELSLQISPQQIRYELDKLASQTYTGYKKKENVSKKDTKKYSIFEYLLCFMLKYPSSFKYSDILEKYLQYIPKDAQIRYTELRSLAERDHDMLAEGKLPESDIWERDNMMPLFLQLDQDYPTDFSDDDILMEFDRLTVRFKEALKK